MSAQIDSTNVILFKNAEMTTVSDSLYNKKGALVLADNFVQFKAENEKTALKIDNILTVSITNNNEEALKISLFDSKMNGYTFVMNDVNARSSKQAINNFLKSLKASSSMCSKKVFTLTSNFTSKVNQRKSEIPAAFKLTNVNSGYKVCAHYKSQHILVPYGFSDESLIKTSQFHHESKFPIVSLYTLNKQCFLTTSMPVIKDKMMDEASPYFISEKISQVSNIEEEALTLFCHSLNVKMMTILKIRYDNFFNDQYMYNLNESDNNSSIYNQITNNLQSLKSVISQTAISASTNALDLSTTNSNFNQDFYKGFNQKLFKNEKLELPLSPGKLQNCFVSLLVNMGILSKSYFFDQIYEFFIGSGKKYPAVILTKAQSFLQTAGGTSINGAILKEYLSKKQLHIKNPLSNWLEMMYLLLRRSLDLSCLNSEKPNATLIVDAVSGDYSCVIVSLIKLMTDDQAKTISGFLSVLFESWFDAGHPFQSRCDNIFNIVDCDDASSPIFLLFLFCVNQLIGIDPLMYEFNETFLFDLFRLVYKYELKNNEQERNLKDSSYNEQVKQFVLNKICLKKQKYTNSFYDKFVNHENYKTYRSVKYLTKVKEGIIPQKMNLYDRFFFNLHCGSRLNSLSSKQTEVTQN